MAISLSFAEEFVEEKVVCEFVTAAYTFAGIGPVFANCYQDFNRCIVAAIDYQSHREEGDISDLYIWGGKDNHILCIVTMGANIDYTQNGMELLNHLEHDKRSDTIPVVVVMPVIIPKLLPKVLPITRTEQ